MLELYAPIVRKMSSLTLISAAVAIFIVAALLWWVHQQEARESFADLHGSAPAPALPVAGRRYGAAGELATKYDNVPADLSRAPIASPLLTNVVPPSGQRPIAIPGAPTAPRDAMASRKDLNELDVHINTWLAAATQRETEFPGSLTPVQTQRRVILQARLANVRNQLGTSVITDSYKLVAQENKDLIRENAGWGALAPSLDAIHGFAKGAPEEEFLTAEQYSQFRNLFHAVLNEYKSHTQPDPLQSVRLQQLQVIAQDLQSAERAAAPHPPPIRVSAARLFLEQATKPDQPLPTLLSIAPHPLSSGSGSGPGPGSLAANPADVISQLRDIEWRLTVTYDPAGAALKRQVGAMLQALQVRPSPPPQVVEAARSAVVDLQNKVDSVGSAGSAGSVGSVGSAGSVGTGPEPADLGGRANTLCDQMREAFGHEDAAALGCPKHRITDRFEAETTINMVCDRIHTSVPSVTTQQFNCPLRRV